MKTKYFTGCNTLDELKAAYRKACKANHPDLHPDDPGAEARMKEINDEYESLFNILKARNNAAASANEAGAKWTTETPREFVTVLSKLIALEGLNIELCGSWLWFGGNTYEHRAALKSAGCRWSHSKKMWYWRHEEDAEWRSRGSATISEIREKYGSERIATARAARITA
ncbi:MAG: J domain-containing protein [Oscillospiraceae bacterium]|nr:J domain-containing protein [Oscillospiraceae bacterium]